MTSVPGPADQHMRLRQRFDCWLEDLNPNGDAIPRECSDRLSLRRCWIDMASEHAGGVMLSQIAYWYLVPSRETGETKLRVEKNGGRVLVKSYKDWWDECRLSRSQVNRLLKKFKGYGWIGTEIHRFNGLPTNHITMKWAFLEAWEYSVDNPRRREETEG